MRAVIGMLALGWVHFLLLWIGNMSPKDGAEGEEGKEGEKDRS